MLEIAKAAHAAIGTDSRVVFVLVFMLGTAVVGGVIAVVVDAGYQQELKRTDRSETRYSAMSNKQLTAATMTLVAKIRRLIGEVREATMQQSLRLSEEMGKAHTDEEKHEVWKRAGDRDMAEINRIMSVYDDQYKADAMLLRDELLSRRPPGSAGRRSHMYEFPTNTFGLDEVATDLERQAKNLP